MSVEAEYEAYVSRLKESIDGGKLFLSIPEISKMLYKYLSEAGKDHSMVQTALAWMPEKEVLQLLEKNIVLFLGRALLTAQSFDALDPVRKIEKLIDFFSIVKEEQESWLAEYKKKIEQVHDKAERRKRRKELLAQENVYEKRDRPLCEAWVQFLVKICIPEGTDSLFLPSMAKFFLPKNFLDSFVAKNIEGVMKTIHAKEWKEALLFHVMTFLFQGVFLKTAFQGPPQESVSLNELYFEKGKALTAWVLNLLSVADPVVRFLAKEETTQKAVAIIGPFLSSFSLERSLMKLVQGHFLGKVRLGNLDLLVDRISGDTKAIAFLLKKVASIVMPPLDLSLTPSMGEVLMQGVKGAVIETAIKDKAESLVYQEIPLKIFQYTRLFVLSPFFDRTMYRLSFLGTDG